MNGDDSSPAVDSTGVYVNYACNQAYGFALTGALKWHHSSSCEGGGGATPVLYDGKVWIRDGGANLILEAANGTEVGAFSSGTPPVFSAGVGLFWPAARSLRSGSATACRCGASGVTARCGASRWT